MRLFQTGISTAAAALVVAMSVATPAGAADYRRHHASRHHRHVDDSVAVRRGSRPVFAPPGYVDAGIFGLAGPQGTGLLGHGGVLGTGVSNGQGLLGIGFFGL